MLLCGSIDIESAVAARIRGLAARLAAAALITGAAGAGAGCSFFTDLGPQTCSRSATDNPPVLYTEGTVTGGVYSTSEWNGEWLYFPGGMRYRLQHNLGATPSFWQAYLSFNREGPRPNEDDEDTASMAEAAGNMVEVREIDEQDMIVVNGSCADYWLLVIAGTAAPAPTDAGAD